MTRGVPERVPAPAGPALRAPLATPIRVGIVGYGAIGGVHVQALRGRDDARTVAVCRRGGGQTPEPGVDVHADYRELLARQDIDVAVICTPSGLHAEHVSAALSGGKHVVVEKPITITVGAARELAQEARQRELVLAPISQRRFEPQSAYLKRLIDAGTLGTPVLGEALVRWFRDDAYYRAAPWRGTLDDDGGVLLNQGLHTIDLLCWLFGKCRTAHGVTATLTHAIAAEDTAAATLQFESGALGVVAVTTSARPGSPEELNLFFDRGSVRLQGSSITGWTFPDVPRPDELPAPRGSGANDPLAIGSVGHRAQWDDIVAALAGGRDPSVTADSAIETLETIEQARRS